MKAKDGMEMISVGEFFAKGPGVKTLIVGQFLDGNKGSLAAMAGEEPPFAQQMLSANVLRQRLYRERRSGAIQSPCRVRYAVQDADDGGERSAY